MARWKELIALAGAAVLACGGSQAGPASQPAARPIKPAKGLRINLTARQVVLDAVVSERQEMLEFLLCKKGTKDYESLLVTTVPPSSLHAALLALNLMPGKPARWSQVPGKEPVFLSPSGATLEIAVRWKDAKGRRSKPVTDWLLIAGGKQKPTHNRWVFVGSSFLDDGSYWADEEGHHVSLANFASSVIDVPFRSSDKTAFLEFRPNTDAVPPKGTAVEVVFTAVKGAENAPVARTVFTIDALGRLRMDGRPIAPEDVEKAVKAFLARHTKGAAEVIVDPRALVFDRDRLEKILENAGLTDVTVRTRALADEILPRSADQAAKALAWWKRQFAEAARSIIDPAEDAAAALKHLEHRRKRLGEMSDLWADYAKGLRKLLAEHQAAQKNRPKRGSQDAP